MAEGDYLDPRGDTPVGSTYPIGNLGSNDPLVDWASNLSKDDLAKFLHDPQGQAAEWAARGHPPPDSAMMNQIHDHNESMGTPSRSTRMENVGQADPFTGPYRVDPQTGRLLNLTDPRNQQPVSDGLGQSRKIQMFAPGDPPPPRPEDTAGKPSDKRPIPKTQLTPDPSLEPPVSETGTVPPIVRPGSAADQIAKGQLTPPNVKSRIQQAIPNPLAPNAVPPASSAAGAPAPTTPPPAEPPPAVVPRPPLATAPPQAAPKGEALDKAPSQADKLEETGDAISKLGKAMQGVKAPDPLKPPNIGAPSVRSPLSAGAPPLHALAGLLGGVQTGQVPASVMPILKMLGRG